MAPRAQRAADFLSHAGVQVIQIKNRFTGEVLKEIDATDLRNADLRNADLRNADFRNADFSDADLSDADLRNADLSDADLRNADLRNADLRNADLRNADLRNAVLRNAVLSGAVLRNAVLSGADLSDADLRNAVLRNAVLRTGETWETYLKEVVPALLAAGGHPVACNSWQCHTWENCLVASAFGVKSIQDVPALYRPRCEQLIQLFDAGLVTREAIVAAGGPQL